MLRSTGVADAATGVGQLHFNGLANGVFIIKTALALAIKVVDLIVTKVSDQRSDETQSPEGGGRYVPLPPGAGKLGGVGEDGDGGNTGAETGLIRDAVIKE